MSGRECPAEWPVKEVHYAGTDREEVVWRWVNGRTYVERCLGSSYAPGRSECGEPATQMVGPLSLCDACTEVEHKGRQRSAERARAWAASPEGQAEMRREQEWEARVS